ncbi:MAG: MatK/TrnK amino terminal region [Bacteriophage sp.]|nr:MAG: MatK/TrnK amino terminal region [Bacteriophage sp.]
MKRYSGLHDKLCTIENIEVADDNARKNKNKKYGINKHDKNRQYENEDLVDKLFNLKYKTSKYNILWLKINLKMILLELYAV